MQPIGYGAKMAGLESKIKFRENLIGHFGKRIIRQPAREPGTQKREKKMLGENVKIYPRDHRKMVSGMIVGKNAEAYLIRTESGKYTTAKISTAIVVRKK